MTTVINYIGHGARSKDIEQLFEMLREYALDRSFTSRGDWLEQPVWDHANWPAEWPLDGSGSEVHAFGNFFGHSMPFCLTTDDSELIERLRVAIAANMQMSEYQAQPQPQMSAMMLRYYIDDIGLGAGAPWQAVPPPTSLVLDDAVDASEERITAVLRVDGHVHATMSCHRRALNRHLIQLARRRRTLLGYKPRDIIGPRDGSEPLTVMHALVESWKVLDGGWDVIGGDKPC